MKLTKARFFRVVGYINELRLLGVKSQQLLSNVQITMHTWGWDINLRRRVMHMLRDGQI